METTFILGGFGKLRMVGFTLILGCHIRIEESYESVLELKSMSEAVVAQLRKIFADLPDDFVNANEETAALIESLQIDVIRVVGAWRQRLQDHIDKFPEDPDTVGGMTPDWIQYHHGDIDEWLQELKKIVGGAEP